MNKENAALVLGEALSLYDFMKAPTKVKGVWEIFPAQELAPHKNLPTFEASKTVTPVLVKNHDPIQLTYHTQNGSDQKSMVKSIRVMLSGHGKVTSIAPSTVLIIDRAAVVDKLLPVIQQADIPAKSTPPVKK